MGKYTYGRNGLFRHSHCIQDRRWQVQIIEKRVNRRDSIIRSRGDNLGRKRKEEKSGQGKVLSGPSRGCLNLIPVTWSGRCTTVSPVTQHAGAGVDGQTRLCIVLGDYPCSLQMRG